MTGFYFDWTEGTRIVLVLVIFALSSPFLIREVRREDRIRAELKAKFPEEDFDINGSVLGGCAGLLDFGLYSHNQELEKEIKRMRKSEGWFGCIGLVPFFLSIVALMI